MTFKEFINQPVKTRITHNGALVLEGKYCPFSAELFECSDAGHLTSERNLCGSWCPHFKLAVVHFDTSKVPVAIFRCVDNADRSCNIQLPEGMVLE